MLTSSKFIYAYVLTFPPVSFYLDLALFLPLHFPTCLSLCVKIYPFFFNFCNVFTADYFLACYFFVFIYYLQIVLSSFVPLWATFSTSLNKGHLRFSASLLLHLSLHIPNLIHLNSMLSLKLHCSIYISLPHSCFIFPCETRDFFSFFLCFSDWLSLFIVMPSFNYLTYILKFWILEELSFEYSESCLAPLTLNLDTIWYGQPFHLWGMSFQ